MPRQARKISSTGVYFIEIKANNKLVLSKSDEEVFTECAEKYLKDTIIAKKLTHDTAYFIIKTDKLPELMKPFLTSYTRYFNRVHNTQGRLLKDRYKSIPLETQHVMKNAEHFVNGKTDEIFGVKKAKVSTGSEKAKKAVVKKTEPKKTQVGKEMQEKVEVVKEPQKEPEKPRQKHNLSVWLL